MEAITRKGRSFTKKAELPAVPAANAKGRSGKQQLEDKMTLPRAAILASVVPFEPDLLFCCSSVVIVEIMVLLACAKISERVASLVLR